MFDKDGKLLPNAVPNKSAQTIDGPNESRNDSDKKVVDRKKSLINDFVNTDLPSQDDGYFDTLDASMCFSQLHVLDFLNNYLKIIIYFSVVAKWTDKSKLEVSNVVRDKQFLINVFLIAKIEKWGWNCYHLKELNQFFQPFGLLYIVECNHWRALRKTENKNVLICVVSAAPCAALCVSGSKGCSH